MKFSNRTIRVFAVVAGGAALGACGGGANDARTGGSANVFSASPVAVTGSSAGLVVANVFDAINNAVVGSDLGAGVVTAAVIEGDRTGPGLFGIVRQQLALADRAARVLGSGGQLTGVQREWNRTDFQSNGEPDPCPNTANSRPDAIRLIWEDTDGDNRFSTGDALQMIFDGCRNDSIPIQLDGAVAIDMLTVNGDPGVTPPWDVAGRVSFSGFRASDAVTVLEIDGNLNYREDSSDGVNVSAHITGGTLKMTTTIGNSANNQQMSGFEIRLATQNGNGSYELTASGTVATTGMGGSVDLSTLQTFTGTDFRSGAPDTGEMQINGANGSTLNVKAIGSGAVQMRPDADADGTPDSIIDTTWTDLNNLL